MDSSVGSPVSNHLPPLDAEKERIRDLSRYYGAVRQPSTPQNSSPSISQDIILTALVQLGVYRFECNRAFLSLIDGQNQHIIAEATASISLRDSRKHLPNDGIYLGVTTLDLVFGVCPHAMKLFTGQDVPQLQNTPNMTANPTRFIVRDFTLETTFKDKPYVVDWPFFRFYAEVPVYSPAGNVLGSFCVVDDKPRQAFSEADVATLQEISDSIALHLEHVRMAHCRARSNRLVQGLTNFVKGSSRENPSLPIDSQPNASPVVDISNLIKSPPDRPQAVLLSTESSSLSSKTTDETSSLPSLKKESSGITRSTSESSPPEESFTIIPNITKPKLPRISMGDESSTAGSNGLGGSFISVREDVPISRRIDAIFSHARSLLKASMDIDDIFFLDACHCNSGISSSDSTEWEPFPTTVDSGHSSSTPADPQKTLSKHAFCKVLGSSSGILANNNSQDSISPCRVTESFLKHLISKYPQGEVFDLGDIPPSGFDEKVNAECEARNTLRAPWPSSNYRTSGQKLVHRTAARLSSCFPEAKSVIFLPLWDWNKGQWLAGTLIWTRDTERPLEQDGFHYFKVFGDTIVSEIARANNYELEKSKSDFISSISHELRSPLHGILASAELLYGTDLKIEQQDLVKMLETCGHTLLDTMNHLLDFTKINNLTSMEDETSLHKPSFDLVSMFDLGILLEEVVNSLYVEKLHSATVSRYTGSSTYQEMRVSKENLSVVVRISDEYSWQLHSVSGVWRRIIMNVFGNSLKFTREGFIELFLRKTTRGSKSSTEFAHLSIIDTGSGMTADFLRNKLFSPFAQEDSLFEGVGLGMSIVQQLVTLMKGSIDVKSERDVGTQVDIFIPIQTIVYSPALLLNPSTSATAKPNQTKFSLIGFNGYPKLAEVPTGRLGREAKRRLCIQSLFAHIITQHSDWSVSFAETLDAAYGDVAIVEAASLSQLIKVWQSQSLNKITFARLVILGGGDSTLATSALKNQTDIVNIHPPFYPRKIIDALERPLKPIYEETKSITEPLPEISRLHSSLYQMKATVHVAESSPSESDLETLTHSFAETSIISMPRSALDKPENIHVLIVDDNEINLKVLSRYISKLGHSYETANNGLIALNKYKGHHVSFQLVLMDISMPVMDGIVATSEIRTYEKQQALDPVTILAVTGVASATMQQQALSAGVNNYLIKPLSLQQLRRVIKATSESG